MLWGGEKRLVEKKLPPLPFLLEVRLMVVGVGVGTDDDEIMLLVTLLLGYFDVDTISTCMLLWAMLRGYVDVDTEEARRLANLCL